MEKKKSRCMALDCCCYFIPASHCYLDSISKWGAVGVKIDF